jgi:hypothetical protein
MRCLQDHEKYFSRPEAENALSRLVAQARHTGLGGKSWKRLNVFPCGNHFHVGRANTLPANYYKPSPAPKIPSTGELRRKLARIERAWDRANLHRAKVIGQLIEADRIAIETENEMRELQRQVTAMFWPEAR